MLGRDEENEKNLVVETRLDVGHCSMPLEVRGAGGAGELFDRRKCS